MRASPDLSLERYAQRVAVLREEYERRLIAIEDARPIVRLDTAHIRPSNGESNLLHAVVKAEAAERAVAEQHARDLATLDAWWFAAVEAIQRECGL